MHLLYISVYKINLVFKRYIYIKRENREAGAVLMSNTPAPTIVINARPHYPILIDVRFFP